VDSDTDMACVLAKLVLAVLGFGIKYTPKIEIACPPQNSFFFFNKNSEAGGMGIRCLVPSELGGLPVPHCGLGSGGCSSVVSTTSSLAVRVKTVGNLV